MKKTFVQLSLVVGIAIVVGGIYNLATSSADNHLALTVKDGRYANALVCKRSSGDEGVPVGKQPAGVTPPAPAVVDPVKPAVVVPVETPAEEEKPAPVEEEAKTPRILVDEAFEEWEAGSLFIDARRSKVYVKGHIPGAVSISSSAPRLTRTRLFGSSKTSCSTWLPPLALARHTGSPHSPSMRMATKSCMEDLISGSM